ncbi:MAG: hypothetical protein LBC33_01730, partial [Mycoplasmataceae bacterium]|nr:hypothetical protein [Mycoplasmataceae bacterium]
DWNTQKIININNGIKGFYLPYNASGSYTLSLIYTTARNNERACKITLPFSFINAHIINGIIETTSNNMIDDPYRWFQNF